MSLSKRLARRLGGGLLLGAILLSCSAPLGAAPPELTLKEKLGRADLVALVQVRVKSWYPSAEDAVLRRRAILRVVTSYHGKPEGTEVTVAYGATSECKETSYQVGQSWLVFLKRQKPGVYTTLNCHFGQMQPWEGVLDRVRAMAGPGKMIGAPLKNGEPLTRAVPELLSSEWSTLGICGISPGMDALTVSAIAGPPDRSAHAGRWWYWKSTDVRARFDATQHVDLVEGPTVTLRQKPLLRRDDLAEAANSLGDPSRSLGAWSLYGQYGRYIGVRAQGERLARFCLTSGDRALRSYVMSLQPASNKANPVESSAQRGVAAKRNRKA